MPLNGRGSWQVLSRRETSYVIMIYISSYSAACRSRLSHPVVVRKRNIVSKSFSLFVIVIDRPFWDCLWMHKLRKSPRIPPQIVCLQEKALVCRLHRPRPQPLSLPHCRSLQCVSTLTLPPHSLYPCLPTPPHSILFARSPPPLLHTGPHPPKLGLAPRG